MKKISVLIAVVAALAISASWAGASVILQFNNNPNDVVDGSPETIQAAPGTNVVISLQLVSTSQTTASLDYWLSQFSGPGFVFSITGRDYTGSDFNRPEWGNGVTTTTRDDFSNSQLSSLHHPDGIPDNLIAPRNGPDLGGRWSGADFNPPGSHQVTTFTLTISLDAAPGLYQIQTFDYPGNGYSEFTDGNFINHDFDGQAAINIQVVPEPTTWLLVGLGIIVALGLNMSRLRAASRDRR